MLVYLGEFLDFIVNGGMVKKINLMLLLFLMLELASLDNLLDT